MRELDEILEYPGMKTLLRMPRVVTLATVAWSAWAIGLASIGGALSQDSLWIAAATGSFLAVAWLALLFALVVARIRPDRLDLWALAACPIAWLIAGGAIIRADLDVLKKLPIIERVKWERLIGNTATQPVNRTPAVHDCYVRQARAAGNTDILWVGDSITNNWRTDGRAVWKREFGRLRCLNFGIGGDRTQNILWRLEHGELEGPEPSVVVLEAGTNNLNRNSAAEIAAAIEAIVAVLRNRLPSSRIIVMAIFPRGERLDEPINARIRDINGRLLLLDDGDRVRVLNLGEWLADASGDLRAAMIDGVHLSAEGYRIWAEAIRPALHELLDRRS